MASYNKVILMGNLVARPELQFSKTGKPWTSFRLAVNQNYKSAEGEEKERVSFFEVTSWGKQAEVLSQYLDKGSPLLVDGSLEQDRWQAKDGTNRSTIKVNLRRFQFLPRRGGAEARHGSRAA